MTARSMTFCSSRTLPGHVWPPEAFECLVRDLTHVFQAVPQGWYQDRKYIQPVEKIRPEPPLRDHLFQVGIRGGDHAHINADRASAANTLILPFLQNTQELRLQL